MPRTESHAIALDALGVAGYPATLQDDDDGIGYVVERPAGRRVVVTAGGGAFADRAGRDAGEIAEGWTIDVYCSRCCDDCTANGHAFEIEHDGSADALAPAVARAIAKADAAGVA